MRIKEQLKPQDFDMLIRSDPDMWPQLQGTPQHYQQFLEEFYTYDDFLKGIDIDDDEDGKPGETPKEPAA
jgi:hypothetical protein